MNDKPASSDTPALFAQAIKLPESQRDTFLRQHCEGDDGLLEQLRGLIQAHDDPDSFLAMGALDIDAPTEDVEPSHSESIGSTIGPYKLLQELGEGGMGTVYMAEQTRPVKRRVAIKIIKRGMDSRQFVARFEAERQALAMMDHPNIAKVLDAGCTDAGRPYFVMELVKGIPVTRYCDDNRLPARQRLELFIQVCQAVQHAHQKGIIHRDLKPSNVLVAMYDDRPVPKVIDFGVAKATNQQLTDKTLFTMVGQIVGTWEYMSPEQAVLNQLDVDTRSDIYSLGVILYELLTGVTPIDKERLRSAALEETLRLIREEEPPKPSTRVSGLGSSASTTAAYRRTDTSNLAKTLRGDLDWIVMKALDKDRARRYGTANGLGEDIRRYLAEEPIEARPPSTFYALQKTIRRHKGPAVAAASVVTVLLVGVVVFSLLAVRLREALRDREGALASVSTALGFVKDYTMLLALTGDRDDEQKAVEIAGFAGASPVWIEMLHGQAAIQRGEMDLAIGHLKQGVAIDKDDLACKGLLAAAHIFAGDMDSYMPLRSELERSEPQKHEELLFVGYSWIAEPSKGLPLIAKAMTLRDSLLVHVLRSQLLSRDALEKDKQEQVDAAIESLNRVTNAIRPGPDIVAETLVARMVAMQLAKKRGDAEAFTEMRTLAEHDLRVLEQTPTYTIGYTTRAWFHDCFDSLERADAAWRDALTHGLEGWPRIHAAANLFRTNDVQSARRFLGGNQRLERMALALVLSGQHEYHDEVRRIYSELADSPTTIHFTSGAEIEILALIDLELCRSEALSILESRNFATPFDRSMVSFLANKTDVDRLILAAGDSNSNLAMAHFLVARVRMAEGQMAEAKTHLQKTVDTRFFPVGDYYWAKAYLARMEDDEAWPEWVNRTQVPDDARIGFP